MPLVPPVIRALSAGMMGSFAYFWTGVSGSVRGALGSAAPPLLAAYDRLAVAATWDVHAALAALGNLGVCSRTPRQRRGLRPRCGTGHDRWPLEKSSRRPCACSSSRAT